jgi:hypothetical protein
MEVIEINIPPGLPDDFFCPLSGEPAMSDAGLLAVSCVAYIPPLAFHDAVIGCQHFGSYWEGVLENADVDALQENFTGESIRGFLEAYDGPANQKLIGFRVATTTLHPRVTPEFAEPIYTLPFFYIINFWCDLSEDLGLGI